jgi:hypothetical protein
VRLFRPHLEQRAIWRVVPGSGFGGFLQYACVCVTTAKTGHECRLGGPCLDHVVVAAGMHIDCFVCGGIWICGLKW